MDNLPPWMKKKKSLARREWMFNKNYMLDRERKAYAATQRKKTKIDRLEKGMECKLNSGTGIAADSSLQLNQVVIRLVAQRQLSLLDGKQIPKCVMWWRAGVLPRETIFEAFNNYSIDNMIEAFQQ